MSLVNMAQGQKTLGGVFKERENNDDFQASGLGSQVDIKSLIEQIQQEEYEVLGEKEGERKQGGRRRWLDQEAQQTTRTENEPNYTPEKACHKATFSLA